MKQDGGLIKNWVVHHRPIPLGLTPEDFLIMCPGAKMAPGPMVFTGVVVEDSAGRFKPGSHMRSSYIVSIDRQKVIIETVNSYYKVVDEGDDYYSSNLDGFGYK